MIKNKNLFAKVSTTIIKALKIVYFGNFLVWKLFFRRMIFRRTADRLSWRAAMAKLGQFSVVYDAFKHTNEMWFSEGTPLPLQICLLETVRQNG